MVGGAVLGPFLSLVGLIKSMASVKTLRAGQPSNVRLLVAAIQGGRWVAVGFPANA